MTHDELARRRPLWAAMSELFLDTEVRWTVPSLAQRAAESGYDDEMLERIFWAEVFPEAIGNLSSVAGEWTRLVLDEQALINRANKGSIPWLQRRVSGRLVQHEWLAARTIAGWLRPLSNEERARWVRTLSLLSRLYFESPSTNSVSSEHLDPDARPFIAEAWRRFEPVCKSQRLDDEPAHEVSAARVSAWLRSS